MTQRTERHKVWGWSAASETAIQQKKVTEPQEDGQTIETMRRDVMLMSSGEEEKRAAGQESFRPTERDEEM